MVADVILLTSVTTSIVGNADGAQLVLTFQNAKIPKTLKIALNSTIPVVDSATVKLTLQKKYSLI